MKTIIVPYVKEQSWCEEFFPTQSLCSLPMAGKPIAEYLVDCCSELKIKDILVLDYNYIKELDNKLLHGEPWTIHLEYTGASMFASTANLIQRNKSFVADDDVLIFWGSFMPNCNSFDDIISNMKECPSNESHDDGIYLWKNGKLFKSDIQIYSINSLLEYFQLNFTILEHPGCFVLNGYSAENNVYTGMNVAIMRDVEIKAPIMLSDDVCLEEGCFLADGVILGNNVMVDRGTAICHSLVLNHTFVGRDMIIENKIVSAERIIDPIENVYMDQDDMGIAMDMHNVDAFDWYTPYQWCLALLLVIIFLIPYLIYLPFSPFLKKTLWAYKFSTDRYPKCLSVLFNKAKLIRFANTDNNFVFRPSDASTLSMTPEQMELDDIFFKHHRSPYQVLRIVIKGLINRSFATNVPK